MDWDNHSITLDVALLDEQLPALYEEINSSVVIVTKLSEAFSAHREKFFTDNRLAAQLDPIAWTLWYERLAILLCFLEMVVGLPDERLWIVRRCLSRGG